MFPGILAGNSLAQSRSTGEVVPAAPGQQPRCAACSSPSPPAWLAFPAGWPWQHDPGLGTATAGPHGAAASRGERGASPSRSTRWCCKTALLPGLHRSGACGHRLGRGPGRATEGQLGPGPQQAGWRVTREGTGPQPCPRRGASLPLGCSRCSLCQPGAGMRHHGISTGTDTSVPQPCLHPSLDHVPAKLGVHKSLEPKAAANTPVGFPRAKHRAQSLLGTCQP